MGGFCFLLIYLAFSNRSLLIYIYLKGPFAGYVNKHLSALKVVKAFFSKALPNTPLDIKMYKVDTHRHKNRHEIIGSIPTLIGWHDSSTNGSAQSSRLVHELISLDPYSILSSS